MSRSGYSDDCENLNLYRASVDRAVRGKRGQAFLREMAAALDAMPVKELITDRVVEDGSVCAIGSVALARGIDVSTLDVHNGTRVAARFGIAPALACEIAYANDECGDYRHRDTDGRYREETPAERWTRMREWVARYLLPPVTP